MRPVQLKGFANRRRLPLLKHVCLLVALCAVIFGARAASADEAQPGSYDWMVEMAETALFHVSVEGELRDQNPDLQKVRQGKAFLVGPGLLVTAQRVVGEQDEWKTKTRAESGLPAEIYRVLKPLNRKVTLTPAGDVPAAQLADVTVLPTQAADLAAISLPNLAPQKYFRLSMCDISRDKTYKAIMTTFDPPGNPDSVQQMIPIELKPSDPQARRYGTLYSFDVIDASNFISTPDGHEGSPILDEDGSVVAVVSAVFTDDNNKYRVLAAPIQPLFPAAAALLMRAPETISLADENPRCSLSATVRRMHDQLAAFATWKIKVARDKEGRPTGELRLSYDSVTDPPNIESIEIEYEFWGIENEKKGNTAVRINHRRGDENKVKNLLPSDDNPREFITSEIVPVGNKDVQDYLREINQKGSIWYVKLYITPTLKDASVQPPLSLVEFQWVESQKK